jgi:hypothetical protein
MIVPKNIYLFFLSNWEGKSYFLDSSRNIQLGNNASGIDYSLQDGPANWLDIELGFAQNQHYYGLVRSFSTDLKFVKSGATILRKLLYEGRGIDQQIFFIATRWNSANGTYELDYKGELDFSQISEDDPITGITIKCLEGGISKLIKSYENTVFEIPCDGSITENKSILFNGLMFEAIFNFDFLPLNFSVNGNVLPIAFTTEQGNDVGITKNSQTYRSFTARDAGNIATIKAAGNYFFSSIRPILQSNPQGGMTISGSVTFSGSIGDGRLFIMFTDSTADVDLIPTQVIGTQTITFSQTFDVPAGAGMILCFYCDSGSSASIVSGGMQIIFKSQFEDTYAYGISPGDLFRLLMAKIYYTASQNQTQDPLSQSDNNISYPISCSLLDSYANLPIVPGSSLRNNQNAVIKTSLSEFFDSFNVELMAAMGRDEDNDGEEEIYFEHRETCFDSSVNDIDLGEVAKLKITPANDLVPDVVKIGYPEQKYDNKQGNDEVNTTAQYRTPYKKEQRELNLVSKYRGDSFGIEYARYLVGTTNTSNNKSDNDNFIVNIDLDSTQSVGMTIDSVLSESLPGHIYYRDNLIIDDTRTFLNWPIIYNSIQGTSFKDNFAFDNGSFVYPTDTQPIQFNNSKIKWTNTGAGTTKVNGNVNIEGVINGIVVVLNLSNGYTVFPSITTGHYQFKFDLYQNQNIIETRTINVVLGDLFALTIPFSMDLAFGDNFYVTWSVVPYIIQDGINYIKANGDLKEVLTTTAIGNFDKVNFNITSNDQTIYNLKRVVYDNSSDDGITDIRWRYNVEQMTSSRLMDRHSNWFRSIFNNMVTDSFKFQTSDKNHYLTTTLNGVQFSEGQDIVIGSMNPNILFYPFYLSFDTEIPITFTELMNKSRKAHIHFTYYGVDFYGFAIEVKVRPALNPVQTWKLLASPANDLSNFSNLDLSGIKLLNLQKMQVSIAHLNPVKFYPANITQDARYNFKHMDTDFFIQQHDFWAQKKDYYQKWQLNDTISLQVISNAIAPAVITMYNANGILVNTINMTQKTDPAIYSPNLLFEANINLSAYNIGVYYFVLSVGSSPSIVQFVSEAIQIALVWPKSLLFEYTHSSNRQDMIFSTGFKPSWRVEGWFDNYTPKSHTSAFEDQPADMKILNSIVYGTQRLNIGDNDGLPPYSVRLANYIMGLDTVLIDGLGFSKAAEDTEFEKIEIPGWPKKYYQLEVRLKENENGISAGTIVGGSPTDEDLFVTYQVNQKGFGERLGGDNIVYIKKIE